MSRCEYDDDMRTSLVCTAAGEPFIDVQAAKAHLRIDDDAFDEDGLILRLVGVIQAKFDGADGYLRRALCTQTWVVTLPHFPRGTRYYDRYHYSSSNPRRLKLPLPPIGSVTSVTYFDINNVQQTLDPSAYSLINCGTEPSYLVPVPTLGWPSTQSRDDAVQVTFVAGYGDPDDVPSTIVHAGLLLLTDLYEHRGDSVPSPGMLSLPNGVANLLYNFRITSF